MSRTSLRSELIAGRDSGAFLRNSNVCLRFCDLAAGSCFEGGSEKLRGRSVLIAAGDPLAAAVALIELDGVARRIVLCPADLNRRYLPFVMDSAETDAVVTDGSVDIPDHAAVRHRLTCNPRVVRSSPAAGSTQQTEWILLTSGTTGVPKLVSHTLKSLAGAIGGAAGSSDAIIWSTFYDIRRYGGLQIFLRAVLTGTSLVLPDEGMPTSDFLLCAAVCGVTHISGTPSHWRRALMSPAASALNPQYVRLSGEIADQGILDHLRSFYPSARISHAFATTEAGVAFDVNDGRAGFPADLVGRSSGVELKAEDGSLRIRSSRVASRYLGPDAGPIAGPDGFVDTRDMVVLRGDRYYFAGRRDGVINVGGLKVHPEEVEGVINSHPSVRISLVRGRKNPITGALVVADVVLREACASSASNSGEIKANLLRHCRNSLPAHKVPAVMTFVPSLDIAETGKLVRFHA